MWHGDETLRRPCQDAGIESPTALGKAGQEMAKLGIRMHAETPRIERKEFKLGLLVVSNQ